VKKLKLIKRKREIVFENCVPATKGNYRYDAFGSSVTSMVMLSRRIDVFEEEIRKKMEEEMIVFSNKVHSQEFLRSLVPSLRNKDKKK
jgi:hypothetical protein